jgi:F-type H+-transporting ATPase subunit delta
VRQAERSELPIVRALAEMERIAAGVQKELLAVVHTARPLGTTEVSRLTQALGRAYDATVHLNIVEDPGLIGGLRIQIGDDVIDGSVVNKLDAARRRLAGSPS